MSSSLALAQTAKKKKSSAQEAASQTETAPAPKRNYSIDVPPPPPPAPPVQEDPAASGGSSNSDSNGVPTLAFLQAKAEQNAVTAKLNYGIGNYDENNRTTNAKVQSTKNAATIFSAEFERGWTDTFSAGLALQYISAQWDNTPTTGSTTSTKASGLGDILVNLRSFCPMEGWNLQYGGQIGISPGKHTRDISGTTTTDNAYSGGYFLDPYVGIAYKAAPSHVVGGKLGYKWLFDRDVEIKVGSNTANLKYKGGNTVKLVGIYEFQMETGAIDAYVGYFSQPDYTVSQTAPAALGGNAEITAKGLSGLLFGLAYGQYLSEDFMVGLQYEGFSLAEGQSIQNPTSTKQTAHLRSEFTVGARYTF